jgi:hypothetical protein
MRARPCWIALACSLAAPGVAAGAYNPTLELSFDSYQAGAAPAVTAVMRQELAEETTRTIASRFPPEVTFNPAFAVARCGPAEERARSCPAASQLGRASVVSPLGRAAGTVHLTSDFRLLALLEAVAGLVEAPIVGKIYALPDGSPEIVFDDLPNTPITEARLELDGGRRGIFLNPRDCRDYMVGARFVSRSGTVVRQDFPFEVVGCPRPPSITGAAVKPRRAVAGERLRLSWSLSEASLRTNVQLYRRAAGVWRSLGRRRAAGAQGANKLRIGRRWKGRRLRPGRYRVALRAIAAGGVHSRAAWARFRIVPRS